MAASCRSCNAPVVWTVTTSGARMPLDAVPLPGDSVVGLFVLVKRVDDAPLAVAAASVIDTAAVHVDGVAFFRSHFASCPDARTHRKPRPLSSAIAERAA